MLNAFCRMQNIKPNTLESVYQDVIPFFQATDLMVTLDDAHTNRKILRCTRDDSI